MLHQAKTMGKLIKEVFEAHDLTGKIGDYVQFKPEDKDSGLMPLYMEVIEKSPSWTGKGFIVAIAHTYTQNGDLMYDPEITYLVCQHSGEWMAFPLSYEQSYFGMRRQYVKFTDKGYSSSERMQKDLCGFSRTWVSNIKAQFGMKAGKAGKTIVTTVKRAEICGKAYTNGWMVWGRA